MENDSAQPPDGSIFGFSVVKQTSVGLCTSVPAAGSSSSWAVNFPGCSAGGALVINTPPVFTAGPGDVFLYGI